MVLGCVDLASSEGREGQPDARGTRRGARLRSVGARARGHESLRRAILVDVVSVFIVGVCIHELT